VQPTNSRLYQSQSHTEAQRHGIEQQRQRARRTAAWVGAIAVLVYVGFILSGVIGR
jgi:fatty acid desaturase